MLVGIKAAYNTFRCLAPATDNGNYVKLAHENECEGVLGQQNF